MASSIPHGARSTANRVLSGVDLTRKWILVTGCNEEIGFETISASAAQRAARADPALQRSRRGLAVSRGCENRSALQSNPRRSHPVRTGWSLSSVCEDSPPTCNLRIIPSFLR